MKFRELKIKGSYEIILEPKIDNRGFFTRVYDDRVFKKYGLNTEWVNQNHSFSKEKGTYRGFHFQYPPDQEDKCLRLINGKVFYVVLDLRKDSITFKKIDTLELSSNKMNMLYIPKGVAVGMCTLTDNVHLVYNVSNYYNKDNEDNIQMLDKALGIDWPIECKIISSRDNNAQTLEEFIDRCGGL